MNLLILTLCVLIKMIMIITAGRLPSPTTPNLQQYVNYPSASFREPITFPKSLPLSTPITFITPTARYYHPTTLRNTRLNSSLYNYTYNTDTDIQVQEDGHLKNVGTDQEILEARGSYNYTDNEGNTFRVSYVANENGFQPQGAHLPEVPPLIKKALRYIAEHPEENGE